MQAQDWTWTTDRLPVPARLVRWGHFGVPVLLFPTAGGDLEELERFGLVGSLEPLIAAGRMKLYGLDGLSMRSWLRADANLAATLRWQSRYEEFLAAEVVPRIRADCLSETLEIVVAGCALGALSALATLCRHPQLFRAAVGLSGTYDLAALTRAPVAGEPPLPSPLRWLESAADAPPAPLQRLRLRQVLLGSGEGEFETPLEAHRLARALAALGVPHSLELWGTGRDHDFSTWRQMLPEYLGRLV